MRSIRTAVSAAALAGALGIAAAAHADTATGTITNVDLATNRITLSNGEIFKLYTPLKASNYQVGQRVEVSWNTRVQGYKSAHEVEVLAQAPATGAMPGHPTPHGATQMQQRMPGDHSAMPGSSATADHNATDKPFRRPAGQTAVPGSATNPQPGGTPVVATISKVDLGENRLVMSNGDIFELGTGLGASGYRVGQQVRVSWAPGEKGYKEAYRIEPIR
ncbi:MAG: hypothetical protein AB7K86_07790 [Rhodospirillales bacterium]